jgi:hypothetical protein
VRKSLADETEPIDERKISKKRENDAREGF